VQCSIKVASAVPTALGSTALSALLEKNYNCVDVTVRVKKSIKITIALQ
jgi:hypothetical protein